MGRTFASLPRNGRPRERLSAHGIDALSESELLALQLRSGTQGASANDLASELLAHFGTLHRIASANIEELMAVRGVGSAKAASVVAGFELGRRVTLASDHLPVLGRASHVAALAIPVLGHLRRERVLLFVCDDKGRLIRRIHLTEGSNRRSLIDVRDVLSAVIRLDGGAFALAHNHPSGDLVPSGADVEVTKSISRGAKAVGLRFLGHIVVGRDRWSQIDT